MNKQPTDETISTAADAHPCIRVEPRAGTDFGARVHFAHGLDFNTVLQRLERNPAPIVNALHAANGLLVMPSVDAIRDDPQLLLRLSQLFGAEVENYRETQMDASKIHESVPQILLVSNIPPASRPPPARPEPPFDADGSLPTQFPRRRGWHTDQSYRRPPPDVSLFYAALPDALKRDIDDCMAIHVRPGTGRSEQAVRAGDQPQPLGANDQPQHQPVVRRHPFDGRPALYLCEAGQLDWVNGPIAGMTPGLHGDGAKLVYTLMSHMTAPRFTYTHEWLRGDLVIYDNRCTVHCATWFDADKHQRLMWRTTTRGNPGAEYAGQSPSWRL